MACRLCLQDKPLMDSHIIPKWCFRILWENGKLIMSRFDDNPVEKVIQGGIKEKLLCHECEELLSPWELHAREKFFDQAKGYHKGETLAVQLSGIDYHKFKLFQLSVLWRASVSSLPYFAAVRLGPHQERMRKLIVNSDPGNPIEYGCIMVLFRFSEIENAKPEEIILPPCAINLGGFKTYRFVLAGAGWIYFVSSHNSQFRWKHHFLNHTGTLTLPVRDYEKAGFFQKLIREYMRAVRSNE